MLKTPFRIGTIEVSNRIVMAPMHSGNCPDGLVTDAVIDHYVSRSAHGATGLIVTEFAYVSNQGKAAPTQVSLADDKTLPGHSRLVTAVHEAGSKVFAQVVLTGGIKTAAEAETLLTKKCCDLVGVGRAILKDADWSRKALSQA